MVYMCSSLDIVHCEIKKKLNPNLKFFKRFLNRFEIYIRFKMFKFDLKEPNFIDLF